MLTTASQRNFHNEEETVLVWRQACKSYNFLLVEELLVLITLANKRSVEKINMLYTFWHDDQS